MGLDLNGNKLLSTSIGKTGESINHIPIEGLVLYIDSKNLNSYSGYGTTWSDLTLNNNDLTLVNGTAFSSVNYDSMYFDGSNDYARLSNFPNTPQSTMTLIYYLKYTFSSGAGWIGLQSRNADDADTEWALGINNNKLYFWDYDSGYGFNNVYQNTTLSTNVWYQLAFVKNGTSGTFYLNGISDGSHTASLDASYGTNDFVIGYDYRDNSSYFQGYISQVFVYNTALSDVNIKQNYNTFKSRYEL